MRLGKVDLSRFRRFEDVPINREGRMLSLVGPNESAKSYLVDELE